MTTLKFRVWDKQSKHYLGNEYLLLNSGEVFIHQTHELANVTKDSVVEFSTGLFDKNKEEIFKGDIVKWFNRNHEVNIGEYDLDTDGYIYPVSGSYISRYGDNRPLAYAIATDDIEIIGNIHEHPELLKGEDENTTHD